MTAFSLQLLESPHRPVQAADHLSLDPPGRKEGIQRLQTDHLRPRNPRLRSRRPRSPRTRTRSPRLLRVLRSPRVVRGTWLEIDALERDFVVRFQPDKTVTAIDHRCLGRE